MFWYNCAHEVHLSCFGVVCLQWAMPGNSVIQWHSMFFYWWHTHCVVWSALCTLSVLIPTSKSFLLRMAQRYFSHGCQFKPRCFGFAWCCSQNFLRSWWFLCAFQSCFLAFFIPRNHLLAGQMQFRMLWCAAASAVPVRCTTGSHWFTSLWHCCQQRW